MAKFQDSNNRLHTGSEYATTGVTQAASLAVKTSAGLFLVCQVTITHLARFILPSTM